MQEPTTQPPEAPVQKPASRKKILIWILVILGIFVILAILIIGGAAYYGYTKIQDLGMTPSQISEDPGQFLGKMVAAAEDNIEFVSSDKEKMLVTFRNKATGETVTVNLEALKTGQIPETLKAPATEPASDKGTEEEGSGETPGSAGPEE